MKIDIFPEMLSWPWEPTDLEIFLPGTQSWLLETAKALAKAEYDVTIYCECKEQTWEGVKFKKRGSWDKVSEILISWNNPDVFQEEWKARRALYWVNTPRLEVLNLKLIDYAICISHFHKELITRGLFEQEKKKFRVIYPGINPDEFGPDGIIKKDPNLCLYASSWDRGLERLLGSWPEIKREFPDFRLIVAYDRNFMAKITGQWQEIPAEWRALPNVEFSCFPRGEMGRLYRRASYLLYPCHGTEMFCLSTWKAQYARCIPVTTDHQALSETVKAGLKVPLDQWATKAIKFLSDHEAIAEVYSEMSGLSFPTWEQATEKWITLLEKQDGRAKKFPLL